MEKIAAAQPGRSPAQDRTTDVPEGSAGAGRCFRAHAALCPIRKVQLGRSRTREDKMISRKFERSFAAVALPLVVAFVSSSALWAQRDPAEPPQAKPALKLLPRPADAISRREVDEAGMRGLIEELVSCGTRNSRSPWTDPKRGAGCGLDRIVARWNEIAKSSGGKLQVTVDKFEATSARTNNKPVHMENVYGVLPGRDAQLAKTVFIISGHFDSRASDVMDPNLDAPGADDDASGVAVSMECARLLSRMAANGAGNYRATL